MGLRFSELDVAAAPSAVEIHRSDRRAAVAQLLAILAILAVLCGFWYQARVYESHRGQDLDMPEWYVINWKLTLALLPLMLLGGLLDLASLAIYCCGGARRNWPTRAAFWLLWAVSLFFVGLLAYCRVP
jgi:hypothetical protein